MAPGPLCPLSCLSPLQREECLGSCASLSPSAHHSQAGTVPGCPVGTPKPLLLLGACSSTPHSGRLQPPCSSPGPRHGKQQLSRNFSEVCQTRATKPKPSPGTGTFLGAENATVIRETLFQWLPRHPLPGAPVWAVFPKGTFCAGDPKKGCTTQPCKETWLNSVHLAAIKTHINFEGGLRLGPGRWRRCGGVGAGSVLSLEPTQPVLRSHGTLRAETF